MRRVAAVFAMLAPALLLPGPGRADTFVFQGRVTMADGSPPPKPAGIEWACPGRRTNVIAVTGKAGTFAWVYQGTEYGSSVFSNSTNTETGDLTTQQFVLNEVRMGGCVLRAVLTGYASSTIDLSDRKITQNPHLPDLVLKRQAAGEGLEIDLGSAVPHQAQKAWDRATKALQAKNWEQAETELRSVATAAPKFALGWSALALACANEHKQADAREALEHAVELDPKTLSTRFRLMRAEMDVKDWPAAEATAKALIQADGKKTYPQAYLDLATIQFHLQRVDDAIANATEEIRLDPNHELPRAEYILGMLEAAKGNYDSAREHMREYLRLEPKASDADEVRTRIDNVGKPGSADIASALDMPDVQLAPAGETWVPGGIKALAAMAGIEGATYANFFHEFCEAIAGQAAPEDGKAIPQYTASLQAFMSAVVDLSALGEHKDDGVVVTLSLADDERRQRTARALQSMGWKLAPENGGYAVEPSDQAADAVRQKIPAALGIDEIAMKQALEGGRSYSFEVKSENARLIGGSAWGLLLKGAPQVPGGLADAFTRDWRFAEAYAALSAMGTDAAAAVAGGTGLQAIVTRYADILWLYADAFRVSNGAAVTPGGAEAEAAWRALAGADPHAASAFFRALIDKDRGSLLSFYYLLSRADAARQRFFTATPARAQRFYAWYRDSGDVRAGKLRYSETWHARFLQDAPVDEAGSVHYPGGRSAWAGSAAADDDALTSLPALEALVPVARIEEKRKAALDTESAALLARRYADWRELFPYFEKLPGLGKGEFQALAAFTDAAAKAPPATRNPMLGEWHAVVELIVLASEAGSLDAAGGARWFRRACESLTANDYSAGALATLREMAGGGADLDEALAKLLKLDGARREAFDQVRVLQQSARLDSLGAAPDPAKAMAALTGFLYAALLQPGQLLVMEEPGLAARHEFVRADSAGLFPRTELVVGASTHFAGGFMRFEEEAKRLAPAGDGVEAGGEDGVGTARSGAAARPSDGKAEAQAEAKVRPEAVFRTNARLVEVYATVMDGSRYVDDLSREEFHVIESGKELPLAAFENRAAGISCALLLDTTGSMQEALPVLKSTALKLIRELRPMDSMAIYSFNDKVNLLQPFTTDKDAAARAILRTQAYGKTALYDALVRVNRDMAGRGGKKALIVFTDGADNMSALNGENAVRRAKTVGVPVYTIALGEAIEDKELVRQLASVAKSTGGEAFTVETPSEIPAVFESVARDLTHGYLLAFQPPPEADHGWRPLEVVLRSPRGRKVRAREGYYPE
jgi:Ca-activated chloride channel family protein